MLKALIVFILLANCLVVSAGFSTTYDDAYARWMIKVNGAAYSQDPQQCIKNIAELGDDWTVVKKHEIPCSPVPLVTSTCQYIILKSVMHKQYILAFRGTVGNDQLIEQFLNSSPIQFENYGNVNKYFLTGCSDIVGFWTLFSLQWAMAIGAVSYFECKARRIFCRRNWIFSGGCFGNHNCREDSQGGLFNAWKCKWQQSQPQNGYFSIF